VFGCGRESGHEDVQTAEAAGAVALLGRQDDAGGAVAEGVVGGIGIDADVIGAFLRENAVETFDLEFAVGRTLLAPVVGFQIGRFSAVEERDGVAPAPRDEEVLLLGYGCAGVVVFN